MNKLPYFKLLYKLRFIKYPFKYLLHLSSSALEELDVALPDALPVLAESDLGLALRPKDDESVTGRSPVSLVHEQHSAITVQDGDRVLRPGKEVQLIDKHTHMANQHSVMLKYLDFTPHTKIEYSLHFPQRNLSI